MPERVMASVVLKSRTGMSVYKDFRKLTLSTVDDFRPLITRIDQTVNLLAQAGFQVEAQTEAGVSFSGSKELFEAEFGSGIEQRSATLKQGRGRTREVHYHAAATPLLMSPRIVHIAEAVQLAVPGVSFHLDTPPTPSPTYYFLNVLNDVPALLNVTALHNAGIRGNGVRVSMIDTGFITRVTETHTSTNTKHVTVDHGVRDVKGIWLASDHAHTGKNYFAGGNFTGKVITLGSALPGAATSVDVVYSCLHPHYVSQGYTIDDIRAVGGLDPNTDEYGHGTAEAANVLAVAPGCTFSFVRYDNGHFDANNQWVGQSYPLAGFQAAVQNQNPDIVTCSWGTLGTDNALALEIANAAANGIVVIFSAGNGHTDNPSAHVTSVTHPNLISVGGAYPIQAGGFRASNYASSYDSYIYTNPQRHCPDVVGLVGEMPNASLIMLPTEPNDNMDEEGAAASYPSGDNTQAGDGWVVCSGTSAAAPQTAGIAALLLQQFPTLTPMAVKNILENSARDVDTGSTNSYPVDSASKGWDMATGFGLIDGQAAINFLQQNTFNAYIRDSVEDNGALNAVADRLYASPDVIVRSEKVDYPQDELGQSVKHHNDLCDLVEEGQDNYIYLRLQNRGTLTGNCTGTVYFTDPGMFADPTSWTKIDQITVTDLVPGEFRVAGPITWPESKIPAGGHYCLIAILDSAADPAPDLNAIHSVDDFVAMVRDQNNVAWKNIDVTDLVPGSSAWFSFYISGPAGTSHHGSLTVNLTNFPNNGGSVIVKIAKRLGDTAILKQFQTVADPAVPASTVYSTFKQAGAIGTLSTMQLKSNESTKVTIYYSIPSGAADKNYSIVASFAVDGVTVGSQTQIVNVSQFAFIGNRRTLEIHKRECSWVALMSPYHKVPFSDPQQARDRGYDNCATCIGGSKR